MIDWLSIKAALKTRPSDTVRLMKRGKLTREFPQRRSVGARDQEVRIRFLNHCTIIAVSGNPSTFLTGQNVIGSCELRVVAYNFLVEACRRANIPVSKKEAKRWRAGDFTLSRVDIAGYAKLKAASWRPCVLKAMRMHYAQLKKGMSARGFHYFALVSRRRKHLAAYDKPKQLRSKRRLPRVLQEDRRLRRFLNRTVRVELRLLSTELRTLKLSHGTDWNGVDFKQLLVTELRRHGLGTGGSVLPPPNLKRLNARQWVEIQAWRRGVDILAPLARSTRQRRIQELRNVAGVDVQVQCAESVGDALPLSDIFNADNIVIGHPKRLRNSSLLKPLLVPCRPKR